MVSTQANVVNIAFGDYSGGILGQESDESVVKEGIAAVHAKVTIILLAFSFMKYFSTAKPFFGLIASLTSFQGGSGEDSTWRSPLLNGPVCDQSCRCSKLC